MCSNGKNESGPALSFEFSGEETCIWWCYRVSNLKSRHKNGIKRTCYFTVFQEAEIKLISYMFYELTQMRDTGPDPDCTKFPNVISHVVHFAISWQ